MKHLYLSLVFCCICVSHHMLIAKNKITVPIIDTVAQAINTSNTSEKISPKEELKSLQQGTDAINNPEANNYLDTNERTQLKDYANIKATAFYIEIGLTNPQGEKQSLLVKLK